jgi:hypothetical protein
MELMVRESRVLTWQDPGPGNGEPERIHVHVLQQLHVFLQIGQIN